MQHAAATCAQTAIVDKLVAKVGASGQAKKNKGRTFFLLLALSCCGDREILFSGPVRPLSGTCDPPATAALTIRHHAILFAPDTGTLALQGTIDPSGHITAALTLPGADRAPYHLTLDASRNAGTITGTYATPRCRYAVTLSRSEN
jgi:hypothetical protein